MSEGLHVLYFLVLAQIFENLHIQSGDGYLCRVILYNAGVLKIQIIKPNDDFRILYIESELNFHIENELILIENSEMPRKFAKRYKNFVLFIFPNN